MDEYRFELRLCAWLERERDAVLARQLGGGVSAGAARVFDVVLLEPGPAFDDRAVLTDGSVPPALLESPIGAGRFRDWRRTLGDGPDAERAIERADRMGLIERERRGGREVVRLVDRYPSNWYSRLVAIENKPDLDRPGKLYEQLHFDTSLALVDAVILATESHVTRAHRNRLPDPVGIWQFDPESMTRTVVRPPASLPTAKPGIEVTQRRRGRTDIEVIDPRRKDRARTGLAERVYGKGWRTYSVPACRHFEPEGGPGDGLPYCGHFDRLINPTTDCGPACPGHAPGEPPAVDLRSCRAENSPWRADPPDTRRRQADVTEFE